MGTTALHATARPDGMEISVIGERIAGWVRREGGAKEVARLFGASHRTVEVWRNGQAPGFSHFTAMVAHWGQPFLDDVFAPALTESDMDATRRIQSIKHQFAMLEGMINHETRLDSHGTAPPVDGVLSGAARSGDTAVAGPSLPGECATPKGGLLARQAVFTGAGLVAIALMVFTAVAPGFDRSDTVVRVPSARVARSFRDGLA